MGIEWQGFKVRFSLLKACLSGRSFLVVRGHKGADGELGKGDGCDQWCVGQIRNYEFTEEDDRRSVEDSSRRRGGHSRESITLSMSQRSRSASTFGSFDQRSVNKLAERAKRPKGRNSAMAWPSRVTTSRSPRATRSSTSPPLLRSSLIDTRSIANCITGDTPPRWKVTRTRLLFYRDHGCLDIMSDQHRLPNPRPGQQRAR